MAATTPDGVTPASVVDTSNTQPYWVGLGIRNEAGNSGGTCTGLLINPRTVLFAAHCVDSVTPGGYDAPTSPGNRAQVGYTTDPTFGRTNLREFLVGRLAKRTGDQAAAVEALREAVRIDPSNTAYRVTFAEMLAATGDVAAAREQLRRCLIQKPGDAQIINKMRGLER
jgi:secreted trypsin-like serine protease